MIPQAAPTPSPLPFAALILAIWGAVVDWRYKRKGGKKPSKRDRLLFLFALALVVVFFVVLALIGVGDVAGMIGAATVDFTIVLFVTWELARWRVRSKNPLPQSQKAMP
jgi:drug/metabolite transporter (DMT)-like permease